VVKDVIGIGDKFIICCPIYFSDLKQRGLSQFLPTMLNIMAIIIIIIIFLFIYIFYFSPSLMG